MFTCLLGNLESVRNAPECVQVCKRVSLSFGLRLKISIFRRERDLGVSDESFSFFSFFF